MTAHAILFLLAALFAYIAVSLRVFKSATSLTFIDYSRIADNQALHRAVAARLLLLSFAQVLLGLVAFLFPAHAQLLLAFGFLVLLPAAIVWIVWSARRMHHAG